MLLGMAIAYSYIRKMSNSAIIYRKDVDKMKKTLGLAIIFALVCLISSGADATVYTYNPIPSDLGLSHSRYYAWDIMANITPGERIVDAQLIIQNIWDGSADPNNVLYIHLLDNPPTLPNSISANVTSALDQGYGFTPSTEYVDNWAGQGPMIATYHAPLTWWTRETVVFNFDSALRGSLSNFVLDNNFGIGFDPDCAFSTDRITMRVVTSVPEAGTMLLLGAGLLGIGIFARRKS